MKALLTITLLTILTGSAEPHKEVSLNNAVSPNKKREVVLEADKGSRRYTLYEFKGSDDEFPAFLIREIQTGKVLARVPWRGDANSDEQPLHSHSCVLWNPTGTAVIINTSERNYTHSSIWALDEPTGKFTELVLPDYKTLTGYEAPSSNELRARGHESTNWAKDGNLIYELILFPLITKENGDPFRHKITLHLGSKGFEVVKSEKIKD